MTDTAHLSAPNDNLLGVCAAIGEDFGFNPIWLRLAFATALLVDLEHVLMAYAALGILALGSRLLFPNRRVTALTAPFLAPEAVVEEYRQAA